LVILPFWTSLLIRVYAWIAILQPTGLLNRALGALGLIDAPLVLIYNDFAVVLGLVYSYLPFMVLPVYGSLSQLDESLVEAAADLGSRPARVFVELLLPLSLPGIAAGSLLVFIPAIGEFVIPDLLGGPGTLMVRQGAVAGILRQCRLAGGGGGGDGPRRAADRAPAAGAAPGRAPEGGVSKRLTPFRAAALVLGFGFLYLPIALLVAYSFNASRLVAVWGGWSLRWYGELMVDDKYRVAALNSLKIGVMAASLALVLGTCAGFALARFTRFRGRFVFSFMLLAPLWCPR